MEKLTEQRVQELERISGLTSEQAKEYLLKTVEDEVKHDTAKLYKELESRAKEEAARKPKNMWSMPFRNVRQIMLQRLQSL